MTEVRKLIYIKKELSGRISESADLAVAIAKPKPVSPVWWPDRSPMFLQSVSPTGLLLFAQHHRHSKSDSAQGFQSLNRKASALGG